MTKVKSKSLALLATVFTVVLLLDLWTKHLALTNLALYSTKPVIPNLMNLTLVFNPGAAFGMFGGLPDGIRQATLFGVTIFALLILLWFMFKEAKDDSVSLTALSAVLAGAIGNLVDRARFGSVVDFLDFYFGSYHWPAFNIADSAISIGVAIVVWRSVFPGKKKCEAKAASETTANNESDL